MQNDQMQTKYYTLNGNAKAWQQVAQNVLNEKNLPLDCLVVLSPKEAKTVGVCVTLPKPEMRAFRIGVNKGLRTLGI